MRSVAFVLAGLLLTAQASSAPLTTQQIISNIVERNPSLGSFQAHIDVRLHTGIPFLNPTLEGTTYFKRPDHYEVIFTKVPPYARGFDKLYSDIGDPANWEKRFVLTVAGEREHNGHRDVVLNLVQRVRGQIEHEDVLVDTSRWTVDEMTYYYYNGGTITLQQVYRDEGGYNILSDQHAVIALPHVPRAHGDAHYSGYHFNIAIDDAVFTEKQTKEMGTGQK
ncbi:MAG: hypothetical protein JO140_02910 [Candidatus Eremiobacteraeota bacterium]|nr:hypothetical protein [Candidatus Eremiobacteraeota bacterium]